MESESSLSQIIERIVLLVVPGLGGTGHAAPNPAEIRQGEKRQVQKPRPTKPLRLR